MAKTEDQLQCESTACPHSSLSTNLHCLLDSYILIEPWSIDNLHIESWDVDLSLYGFGESYFMVCGYMTIHCYMAAK